MICWANHKGGRGLRPGVFLLLGVMGTLGLPVAGWANTVGTAIISPERDLVVLSREETKAAASASSALPASLLSSDAAVEKLRALIELSRETGSPRPLGLAVGLLDRLPQEEWTPEVLLMRATIHQRLHRFDQAEADLAKVIEVQPDNSQAWLTRYSIALVRNDLEAAVVACNKLGQHRSGLLAQSCEQELGSFGEQPLESFERLHQALAEASRASAAERDYALVTLAEMATRLDLPMADALWQRSLLQNPDDLYRRGRYADWLLSEGRDVKAADITRGFNDVDTLAVLHAVALTRLNHPDRVALIAELEERFAEAHWRGEFLHQWEYARFLLDVKDDAAAAFEVASANWETQRAQPDRDLLARAANSAGETVNLDLPMQNGEAPL